MVPAMYILFVSRLEKQVASGGNSSTPATRA